MEDGLWSLLPPLSHMLTHYQAALHRCGIHAGVCLSPFKPALVQSQPGKVHQGTEVGDIVVYWALRTDVQRLVVSVVKKNIRHYLIAVRIK